MASFKWVNTTFGNIKSAITGTYRKLGPDHAGRYLASFAWRYNRRYQLETMIPRFVHSAARTEPLPYRLLIAGWLSGISRKVYPQMTKLCALCQTPLTKANRTKEHIIPNAIGGRKKVRNFICKRCNDETGEKWNSALTRQL